MLMDLSHESSSLKPFLSLITDRKLLMGKTIDRVVAEAVAGGVTHVQLREKDLRARDLLTLAEWLRKVVGDRAILVVNERVDVALACEADGVHLPESGLPTRAVRKLVGAHRLIGRSVHSVNEAVRAARDGADYVQLGPIFPTTSHPAATGLGLGVLEVARREVPVPIIAVGGIDCGNAGPVLESGAHGIAVISAIFKAEDPGSAARRLAQIVVAAVASKSRTANDPSYD